jgi:thymidylate kinase
MLCAATLAEMNSNHSAEAAGILRLALQDSGAVYSVTSGVSAFSEVIGRDVDLFVAHRDRQKVVQSAADIYRKHNWLFSSNRRLNGHYWCYAGKIGCNAIFEFDLAGPLQWGPTIFADEPRPDTIVRNLSVDSFASMIKQIVLPLLAGKNEKITERPYSFTLDPASAAYVQMRLEGFFGMELSARLVAAIKDKDTEALFAMVPVLRRATLGRALKRPWLLPRAAFNRLREKLATSPLERSIAPVVALVGPDGVGKSSVISILRDILPQCLPINSTIVRHWRPGLMPPLSIIAGHEVPRQNMANPPRRKAGGFRWLRILYYSVDFVLGTWLKDRPLLSFNKIVLYDRCYLDMQADPRRYGLPNKLGLEWLATFYRPPDAVILLVGDPVDIHNRKPELEVDEIQYIYTQWMSILAQSKNSFVISASGGLNTTAEQVAGTIVNVARAKLFGAPTT